MSVEECVEYYIINRDEFAGEAGHEKLFSFLLKHSPTFQEKVIAIDVGANVGEETKLIDKLCGEKEREILVFEPNPLNVPILEKNVAEVANVHVFPYAVSNEEGTLPFYTYKNQQNSEGYTLGGLRAGGQEIAKVKVVTLDSILEQFPEARIKYVKIDTEGNDTMVIKGLAKNLHRVDMILFEASDCLKDFRGPGEKTPLENCVRMLDDTGFYVYRIGTKRLLQISGEMWDRTYESLLMWSNCFAIKKENQLLRNFIDERGFYV